MSKIEKYEYRAKTGELLGWCKQYQKSIKFEPVVGGVLHVSIEACIDLSNEKKLPVRLVFNNIELQINAQSDIQHIERIYLCKNLEKKYRKR